jgi:hypothetical protein
VVKMWKFVNFFYFASGHKEKTPTSRGATAF